MSELSEWSDIIKRQGEEREAKWKADAATFKAQLPEQIKLLGGMEPEELLTRFLQFSYGDMNHYMLEDKAKYHDAIKAEILQRMNAK